MVFITLILFVIVSGTVLHLLDVLHSTIKKEHSRIHKIVDNLQSCLSLNSPCYLVADALDKIHKCWYTILIILLVYSIVIIVYCLLS